MGALRKHGETIILWFSFCFFVMFFGKKGEQKESNVGSEKFNTVYTFIVFDYSRKH